MKTYQPQTSRPGAIAFLALLVAATLVVAGCIVTSIHPFYTGKDLKFDGQLLGSWVDVKKAPDSDASWVFEKIDTQTYQLTTRDGSETNTFDVHLFMLGQAQFLDCLWRERPGYATPNHILLRVLSLQPELQLQLLNYDWLGDVLKEHPKTLAHVIVPAPAGAENRQDDFTLTAETPALQKFVRKHLNNTNAWLEPLVMKKL